MFEEARRRNRDTFYEMKDCLREIFRESPDRKKGVTKLAYAGFRWQIHRDVTAPHPLLYMITGMLGEEM